MGFMNLIIVGGLVLLGISLIPHIINWVHTVHCPKCGKWFCLDFHSFVVTDKVVGHHRTRNGGGYRNGWRGGGFFDNSRTKDDPFIREWGEARYICRACGRHISIHNVKRDR
jgi:DNA-directed RNA polymerase subunit RPC12/RpoP